MKDFDSIDKITLKDLTQLEECEVPNCNIKNLVIENCPKLNNLDVRSNFLNNLGFLNSLHEPRLSLNISDNDFPRIELDYLSNFTNLFNLRVGNSGWRKARSERFNRFFGSLKFFDRENSELELLDISNTDICTGLSSLESYPKRLERIGCANDWVVRLSGKSNECYMISEELKRYKLNGKLASDFYNLAEWRKDNNRNNYVTITNKVDDNFFNFAGEVGNKLIGQGAFGKVYLGKWNDQPVAIKKLNISFNSLNKSDLIMIKNELDFLGKIKHENIINFLGCEQKDNHLYLIMEYADGGSLNDYINQNKNNNHDWNTNYNFILNITQGLKHLHEKEIVHRDLKSANILLRNNIAKLADFGISKAKTFQTQINEANKIGTVRWMAPEILTENKPHTYQSDIYSLGMIFWEIAAKCTIPFQKDEERFIANNYCRGERETIPNDTPAELAEIINFCWLEEPSERISLSDIESELNGLREVIKIIGIKDNIQNLEEIQPQNNLLKRRNEILSKKLDKGKGKAKTSRLPHNLSIQEQSVQLKENELKELISFLRTKLKSKSINLINKKRKRQERKEKLNILFNNLPFTSEEFITQLENIKKRKKSLSKRLTEAEINQLYQVKRELAELKNEVWQAQVEIPPKKWNMTNNTISNSL